MNLNVGSISFNLDEPNLFRRDPNYIGSLPPLSLDLVPPSLFVDFGSATADFFVFATFLH